MQLLDSVLYSVSLSNLTIVLEKAAGFVFQQNVFINKQLLCLGKGLNYKMT